MSEGTQVLLSDLTPQELDRIESEAELNRSQAAVNKALAARAQAEADAVRAKLMVEYGDIVRGF